MPDVLTLPTQPLGPTRVNPRISIFYGPPKIGKTTELAKLPGNLILDAEKGTELISAQRVPITSISGPTGYKDDGTTIAFTSLDAVFDTIVAQGMAEKEKTGKLPKPPYKFITFDTLDMIEEFCIVTATEKYKQTTIGKSFKEKSVLELPNGGGYYHLRNEVILQIDRFAMICEHLILVSHLRDKVLNKGGVEVSVSDLSLTGKLGQIVSAKADVIGYMYREPGKEGMQISFQTFENSTMGARVPRLAGKQMPLDWNQIFLPNTN